jgi:hypothetical protein
LWRYIQYRGNLFPAISLYILGAAEFLCGLTLLSLDAILATRYFCCDKETGASRARGVIPAGNLRLQGKVPR